MNGKKLKDELETITFAEAGRTIGVSAKTMTRIAEDPTVELRAVFLDGLSPRLRKSEFVKWAKGRQTGTSGKDGTNKKHSS